MKLKTNMNIILSNKVENHKDLFFFKNKTSKHMYDLSKANNMHTYPKHKKSPK